jgi:acetyl esterase/lipase
MLLWRRLNWGVIDVDDCVAGARFLAAQGRVDAKRCVISGGSAGGYTTLAALTFRDFFQGGASYYGVSDIAALARDTHKLESRYLDWLIGPYPQEEARYRERSPLYHADRLAKPVIFFQGRRTPSYRRTRQKAWLRHCDARAIRSAISWSRASSMASGRPATFNAASMRNSPFMRSTSSGPSSRSDARCIQGEKNLQQIPSQPGNG